MSESEKGTQWDEYEEQEEKKAEWTKKPKGEYKVFMRIFQSNNNWESIKEYKRRQ